MTKGNALNYRNCITLKTYPILIKFSTSYYPQCRPSKEASHLTLNILTIEVLKRLVLKDKIKTSASLLPIQFSCPR